MQSPQPTLLVIGIRREGLAFGQAVAAGLADAPIDVPAIPEGLPGAGAPRAAGDGGDGLPRGRRLK